MSKEPKLKGKSPRRSGPYPLGELPVSLAIGIGRHIVHRMAIGHADISGDDFAGIFADAISGMHRSSPLGIADVAWNGCGWSVKTVKDANPFDQTRIRLISGRNSPNYSQGISDPLADLEATGRAVLEIWNARVNEALSEHDDLRIFVMIRNMETREFVILEHEAGRFIPNEFSWKKNKRGNLEGRNRITGEHRFTWQPHGAQFTIIHTVPSSAYRFRITRKPGLIEERHVLNLIQFDDSWIEVVKP